MHKCCFRRWIQANAILVMVLHLAWTNRCWFNQSSPNTDRQIFLDPTLNMVYSKNLFVA
jgi:hypothetical protein